jgi:hypothetical protein
LIRILCTDTATVGYLITSLLDKSHLHSAFSGGDGWGGEGREAWRARVVAFVGIAFMAGGLAGSVVSCTISNTNGAKLMMME